jgi:hypothetical protein
VGFHAHTNARVNIIYIDYIRLRVSLSLYYIVIVRARIRGIVFFFSEGKTFGPVIFMAANVCRMIENPAGRRLFFSMLFLSFSPPVAAGWFEKSRRTFL